jgi:hypothetical protein
LGTGEVTLPTRLSDGQIRVAKLDGMYAPHFGMNLISLPQLDKLGFQGIWENGMMSVVSEGGVVVMERRLEYDGERRRMYQVLIPSAAEMIAAATSRSRTKPTDLMNWHWWLGHADV